MKKILLSILYFLLCIFSIHAQTLYGTTFKGGNYDGGSIYKFMPATNILTVVKSFATYDGGAVYTNFIQAPDGKLYGMTALGGNVGAGVIFSFDPLDSTYTKLKDFDGKDGGASPQGSLVLATDGKLYGMTREGGHNGLGVIFSYDPVDSIYTKLKDFDIDHGFHPASSLLQARDGKLYGMTTDGGSSKAGVIFSFDPVNSTYTELKDFDGNDGGYPQGSLVQVSDGKLYGMTTNGGSRNAGVIFSFNPLTSSYIKLVNFDSTNGAVPFGSLIQARNGKLYGMTSIRGSRGAGVIFSFDPSVSTFRKLVNLDSTFGSKPYGSLIQANDGKLYGMTYEGGSYNRGVIFSYDLSASRYTRLKNLKGNNEVGAPQGSLMQAGNGRLYGMGSSEIFSFDASTSTLATVYDFQTNVGRPSARLTQASDGNIYGMTVNGGFGGSGNIFSIDASTSAYKNLKGFDYTNDGGYPYGGLLQAGDRKLYGMTSGGGIFDGVLFSFDPSNSTYKKLLDIGGRPTGSLIQAKDEKLYGMTNYGGISDAGVIFSYDIQSFTYKILKSFDFVDEVGYPNGQFPSGNLLQASDSKLYGMTPGGGTAGSGVIFAYDPSSSTFTKLKDFDNTNGAYPQGSLIQASDGKLYGMTTAGGSDNKGVIFSYDPSTANYKKLKDFKGNDDGANPRGSLMQASDGKLYGRAVGTESSGSAIIFSFDPSTSTYTKHTEFYDDILDIDYSFLEVKECITKTTWYKDADGDGYGNPYSYRKACIRPTGYVTNNTDCNDNNKAIHSPATYYRDFDHDGFGDPYHPISACSNVPPAGYVKNNYDCYDGEGANQPGYVRIRMCHDGWTQCVYVKDTAEKLSLGWSLGLCPLQSCAADETLMCHNGKQECVKTKGVAAKLAEAGGKWSLGPYCSGVPISNSGSNRQGKLEMAGIEKSTPMQYSLSNYPNPFAGTSIIKYELPLDSKVLIKVYDLAGRAVATLVDEYKKAGIYIVNFDATSLSSGSLFYKIIARSKEGQYERTNQMVKIK